MSRPPSSLVAAGVAAAALAAAGVAYLVARKRRSSGGKADSAKTRRAPADPVPVLLITDIGRDIDDTLALLTLAGLQARGLVRLVGVVTSGGVTELRASIVRWWLRRFGFADESVPIAATDPAAPGRTACFTPEGTPATTAAALEGSAPDLILRLAREHAGVLEIFAVAPMTPLANALSSPGGLDTLRQGLRRLHIQGQATNKSVSGAMGPDFQAFNLREDQAAAEQVFQDLREFVPFSFLGKHAAYQVSLMREDFEVWDRILGTGEMVQAAKDNMNIFRTGNPTLFYKLYPVPEERRTEDKWFGCMSVLSHPYDPLCILLAIMPEIFESRPWLEMSREEGERGTGPVHMTCGNDAQHPGVREPQEVRRILTELIRDGAHMLRQRSAR